jgi:SOS-response transcriptional repressor LexA
MAHYHLAPVHAGHAQWESATLIQQAEPLSTRCAKPLTDRQRAVVSFIRRHLIRHGYPPTQRQIAKGIGLSSVSSVQYQLARLEAQGVLNRDVRAVRGLRLVEGAPSIGRLCPPVQPDDVA